MSGAHELDRHLPRYVSPGRAVLLGSAFLLGLVVWSAVTEVEIVVSAPASARPADGVAELRAPETRRVARVLIAEGAAVARGDVILELESRVLDAQRRSVVEALAETQRSLSDERAVLRWLNDGAVTASTSRSRLKVAEQRSRLAQLDDQARSLESELAAARRRADAARRLLDIRLERHRAAETALARGALSRFDLLRVRQELLTQQAELEALIGHVEVLGNRLSAGRNARQAEATGYRHTVMNTIATLEIEVAELESRLADVEQQRRSGRIVSPTDGVLDQLHVAAGDFVQQGEPLGVVVPDGTALLFETRIAPRQVAFLEPGQPCRIKLDALPFPRYGAVQCTVMALGRDVVDAGDGPGHYLARVRPSTMHLEADGVPVRLQPGATGWVDIVAGRRTVLSFVTDPLLRFTQESLRER